MDGLNLLIGALLFPGHCELMAAWINRLHAHPLGHFWHAVTQRLHDLLVFGALPVAIWFLAATEPPVLLSGPFWREYPFLAAYFALCGLGLLSLLAAVVRQRIRPPEPITYSRVIDLTKRAGEGVNGAGWRSRLARWPGNEVLTVEVNDKALAIPHLSPAWEGLAIAHFSDVHFCGSLSPDFFRAVFAEIRKMDADLVCFTGDLLDDPALASWIGETFGRLSAPLGCWFIFGNHDRLYGHEAGRGELVAAGWGDLGTGREVLLERQQGTLWLAGDETPWLGTPFTTDSANDANLRILLTHTPDHFPRAARAGVELTLAGHNHGGQIRLPLIGPVYSPSRYGVRYAGGTYRRSDKVLHVSRGLSGRRPVRWNCRPELSRLILTAAPRPEQQRRRAIIQRDQRLRTREGNTFVE